MPNDEDILENLSNEEIDQELPSSLDLLKLSGSTVPPLPTL